jgi:hypothetical protein
VSYKSAKVPEDLEVNRQELNRELLLFIREEMLASNNQEVQNLAKEIFDTDDGKAIMEDYLRQKYKKHEFKLI